MTVALASDGSLARKSATARVSQKPSTWGNRGCEEARNPAFLN